MNLLHLRLSRSARRLALGAATLLLLLLAAAAFFEHYAEPIARRRLLASIDERMGTHSTLESLHVSFRPGLRVDGTGLRIPGRAQQPSIQVRAFQFRSNFGSLFSQKATLVTASVQGMSIVVPPGEDHAPIPPAPTGHTHGQHGDFFLAQLTATASELVIQNADPQKYPLTFHLARLVLDDPDSSKPMHFDLVLANPLPLGAIHAHGTIGAFNPQRPRETQLSGRFDFAEANLAAINGVRGHLHGQGTLAGSLGLLIVEGDAATPDFGLAPGLLDTALTSHFHATADALTGEFQLSPVTAHLLGTDITATGRITRIPAGHDIAVETDLHGRAEDLLELLSPTRTPPLFRAALADRGPLHIAPGRARMLEKLQSTGSATLTGLRWSDHQIQQRIDDLSLRAQDHAPEAAEGRAPIAPSTLSDNFQLHDGLLSLSAIDYRLPGATIRMDGTYNLPEETLDFHGILRTAARASHMTTGIKSLLLKPLDVFLSKPGTGMQLPVSLTGHKSDLQLGLDLDHLFRDDKLAPTHGR